VRVESKEGDYLKLLVNRLHIQSLFRDRYGDIAWNRNARDEDEEAQRKAQDAKQEGFEAVQEENSWLTKNAMENFKSGKVQPTNPKMEKIISYAGQTNKSRTSRPLEDEDVGLKSIDDL
jgi:hypothetical protein